MLSRVASLSVTALFEKYNAILRALPNLVPFFVTKYMELCVGNRYAATLHAINQCIVKLAKVRPAENRGGTVGGEM